MYRKLDFDSAYKKKISNLVDNNGPFRIGSSGKLVPRALDGARPSPWVFINHNARKKYCWFWNHVCCQHFNLIPTNCRFNCWKTVVKIKTVKDLFVVYDILKKLDLPAKCGMDMRDYSYTAYAAFIYADTLEEGREYYKIVRDAVPEHIDIILKRGCTEMERLRPSNLWGAITEEELNLERKLLDLFSFDERHYQQAPWYKKEIKENWIKHAIRIGDPTARETAEKMSGDSKIWDRLAVNSITYHNEKPIPVTKTKTPKKKTKVKGK